MKLKSIIFNSLGGVTNELFKVERRKQNSYNIWGKKYFNQIFFNRIGFFLLINLWLIPSLISF